MKKIWLGLGFLSFALGAVGAFLPILPTVPFLLLASFCFLRGSARHHRWFQGTKLYQKHLKDYADSRSMTLTTKLWILLPVSALLILTMILLDKLWVRIGLGAVLALKYWYFFRRIKTTPRQKKTTPPAGEIENTPRR